MYAPLAAQVWPRGILLSTPLSSAGGRYRHSEVKRAATVVADHAEPLACILCFCFVQLLSEHASTGLRSSLLGSCTCVRLGTRAFHAMSRCPKALSLTYEDADISTTMPYLPTRLRPLQSLNFLGRSAKRDPPVKVEWTVWHWFLERCRHIPQHVMYLQSLSPADVAVSSCSLPGWSVSGDRSLSPMPLEIW